MSTPTQTASLSREELLTKQFYEWEISGRGWQTWTDPVELEPAFRPFFRHSVPPSAPFDDARKPTILSSFMDRIRGRGSPSLPNDLSEPEPDAEPTRDKDADASDHLEFRISAPPTLKVSRDMAELFLLSLDVCAGPLSFEIMADRNSIDIVIASRMGDAAQVRSQLAAYFPDAVVRERPAQLAERWNSETPKEWSIVDFGLANEFMLPLSTPRNLDLDPLISIVGALSTLEKDELGMLQILFTTVRNPWTPSIVRAVSDADGDCFFRDAPDMLSLAREKVAKPLFAVVIRLAAQSPSEGRSSSVMRGMYGALTQFSHPAGNELIPLSDVEYPISEHFVDLVLRRSHRSGMIWNSEELASLVHVPSSAVRSQKLRRENDRSKPAPASATGAGLVLGTNEHAGVRTSVSLTPSQRLRHTYVLGASGTGKSTFLLNSILQDIRNGEGIGVLDPHGDLIDKVLEYIPDDRIEDVVLLDPADEAYPVGFNILSAHSELEKTLLSSDLVSVFRRLSTSWGDQMTSVLGNALLAFLESTRGGTLVDLRRFLVESAFRAEFLSTVTDRDIVYFWQREYPLLVGRPQAPLLTRLDTFLRPKLIRRMVGQRQNKLDFRKIMDDRKILLVKLAQGAIGEENSFLMGTLLVAKLHQTAMGRQDTKASDRSPFYLYIDEFQNFITPSMSSILSGARKYGLGLVLAHQDLRQLWSDDSQVASAVIANPCTRVCFRLGDFDADKLHDGFSFFTAADLQNLGVGEAICRIERADYDFNLKTLPFPETPENAQAIREKVVAYSRSQYAVKREDVEATMEIPSETSTNAPIETIAPTELPKEPVAAVRRRAPQTREKQTAPPVTAAAMPGRGGAQHKYLQQLVKRMAEAQGYRAILEQEVLGGTGKVDVSIESAEQKIACEISVTSTGEREFENVQKCIAAGYQSVVVLSSDAKSLNVLRDFISSRLNPSIKESVSFILPENLSQYLEQKQATIAKTEGTVRGYRVKVSYQAVGESEKKAKKQAVSNVIAQAMQRLKKDQPVG